MVSIPACHAGDRGSIPRRGGEFLFFADETKFRIAFFSTPPRNRWGVIFLLQSVCVCVSMNKILDERLHQF